MDVCVCVCCVCVYYKHRVKAVNPIRQEVSVGVSALLYQALCLS